MFCRAFAQLNTDQRMPEHKRFQKTGKQNAGSPQRHTDANLFATLTGDLADPINQILLNSFLRLNVFIKQLACVS